MFIKRNKQSATYYGTGELDGESTNEEFGSSISLSEVYLKDNIYNG